MRESVSDTFSIWIILVVTCGSLSVSWYVLCCGVDCLLSLLPWSIRMPSLCLHSTHTTTIQIMSWCFFFTLYIIITYLTLFSLSMSPFSSSCSFSSILRRKPFCHPFCLSNPFLSTCFSTLSLLFQWINLCVSIYSKDTAALSAFEEYDPRFQSSTRCEFCQALFLVFWYFCHRYKGDLLAVSAYAKSLAKLHSIAMHAGCISAGMTACPNSMMLRSSQLGII